VSDDPDVMIVGGSLVGLSTALYLRRQGVGCLAVERHTSTAIHPRAGHFQLRTVEILRAAGLEEAAPTPCRPNGRFGGNTGVQDAWNLAWKLALVLRGVAGPALLNTYDAERRAIGALMVEQAYSRYVTRVAPYLGTEGMQPIVDDFSLEIGTR
jgi:2-polyprenyl-6-methoxyphenol hydroxylase-like FAD-dependent oxidoreductase